MKNLVKKVFARQGSTSDQFTVPAGVNKLRVVFQENFDDDAFFPTNGLDQFGDMYSWGAAQVGDGTNTSRLSPVNISFFTGIMKAPFHRADGQFINWGTNSHGQLGVGDVATRSVPTLVSGGHVFKKIYRGVNTCYGLKENGELYAWGRNEHGQLGTGDVASRSTPTLVSGHTFTDFWPDQQTFSAVGIFAKDSDGQMWGWGYDGTGSLGNGILGSQSTPTLVLGALDFVKIERCAQSGAVPLHHTLGLTKSGDIYAWGMGTSGQLGDNAIQTRSSPVAVIGGLKFRDIMAGTDFSMGLTKDGTLYAWGLNTAGQLGQGNIFPKSSPVAVTGLSSVGTWKAYAAGQSAYAIGNDRRLYAWGHQETLFPVLGTNDVAKKSVPTLVFSIGSADIVECLVKPLQGSFVEAVTKFGTRYGWGENTAAGNLGINSGTLRFSAPQQVLGPNIVGPTTDGNIWWKRPEVKSEVHEVDVTPGDTITIAYTPGPIVIGELGLSSSQFCKRVEFQWVG
jgi:alpha-tubulin suppressor-like RCC1 family protein